MSAVGFQQIEDEAEQGGLSGPVVAYQTDDFTSFDHIAVDVEGYV